MRRAFSALNGYQYEDAYKEQGLTPPHSKAPFGRKTVLLMLKERLIPAQRAALGTDRPIPSHR
jgi:hypothetical protein